MTAPEDEPSCEAETPPPVRGLLAPMAPRRPTTGAARPVAATGSTAPPFMIVTAHAPEAAARSTWMPSFAVAVIAPPSSMAASPEVGPSDGR